MSHLILPTLVLEDSFGQLRRCGKGRAECVLYWCAPLDRPDRLTRAVHPAHESGYAWYEVDSAWLTGFFLDLRRRRETVRVQVHTHPAGAGHSHTDDQFSRPPPGSCPWSSLSSRPDRPGSPEPRSS